MPGKMKYKTPNRETPNGKLCGFCRKDLFYRQKVFCSKEYTFTVLGKMFNMNRATAHKIITGLRYKNTEP